MSKISIVGNASGTGEITLTSPNTDSSYTLILPGGIFALTDAATISISFASNSTFSVTLGGNRTMDNPTNAVAGMTGSIFISQDATGGRTLAWSSYWDFPNGTAPTLSTTANAVDRIDYIVRSSTSIQAVFTANYS